MRPVVIIGAGPYGLAAAAHLSAREVPLRVFGQPMDSWRLRMPKGMFLKSTPSASSISDPAGRGSLWAFRRARGVPPGGDLHPIDIAEFIEYGEWFQQNLVPELETSRVTRVAAADGGGGFSVTLDTGEELEARAVVVATGLQPFARVPPELADLVGQGLASHPSAHADLSCFADRRVAVIGAGQSALESAALLHESRAHPTVIARCASLLFAVPPTSDRCQDRPLPVRAAKPGTVLGPGWSHLAFSRVPAAFRHLPDPTREHLVRTVLGPSGAWWLRDRVEGRFPVLLGQSVQAVESADGVLRLRLNGAPEVLEADHVLTATGYRVDVDRIPELDGAVRGALRRSPSGSPRLDRNFQSSVPDLYFTGLSAADSFGPLMRFVAGTGFTARRISSAIAAGNGA
ncbi:FAD-dependent oxidoreductase [Streptacidiphilus melanogenes]|uniref:FAD-dependent oxidoreductase n=1 Tax=Streptacidiphilus melanogenes TaxID=411235 RepID=UPI0005A66A18|nr:FAD-dependent oxidoreductase [Streptacidiphilus melanogenes]